MLVDVGLTALLADCNGSGGIVSCDNGGIVFGPEHTSAALSGHTAALSDCNGSGGIVGCDNGGVVSGPQHSSVHTAALSDCNGSGAIHLIRNCISRNIFDDEP